ncbi:MAG: hypothetical protein CVV27_16835, partial [Candidatus Melainabacteria bacterium HGW-Melainabacteria-1]
MKDLSFKSLALGLMLGWMLQSLTGAVSPGERELERMRSEIETGNRHLEKISRSLDRIDDAFGSSYLNVKT